MKIIFFKHFDTNNFPYTSNINFVNYTKCEDNINAIFEDTYFHIIKIIKISLLNNNALQLFCCHNIDAFHDILEFSSNVNIKTYTNILNKTYITKKMINNQTKYDINTKRNKNCFKLFLIDNKNVNQFETHDQNKNKENINSKKTIMQYGMGRKNKKDGNLQFGIHLP